ncbi:MAG: hypothetical protein K6U89_05585 [Chloroflexi bacterium]|nr:hypothetical protein [Chloroflexota bacterium]
MRQATKWLRRRWLLWRADVLEREAARLRGEPTVLDDPYFVSYVNPIAAALWSGALHLIEGRAGNRGSSGKENPQARAAELERRAAELRSAANRL